MNDDERRALADRLDRLATGRPSWEVRLNLTHEERDTIRAAVAELRSSTGLREVLPPDIIAVAEALDSGLALPDGWRVEPDWAEVQLDFYDETEGWVEGLTPHGSEWRTRMVGRFPSAQAAVDVITGRALHDEETDR